ncbi:MAG: transcription antitermination factor NusB [Ammonifex sp.]|jgi:N utilization substance protein B|nr:MAG: transcription antitermination factor NusB [Ammonifex sp.]
MSRHRAREAVLVVLFQVDVGNAQPDEAFQRTMDDRSVEGQDREFAQSAVSGTLENLHRIDEIIKCLSRDWKIERMNRVDRNLMRLALYEILYRNDIPPSVAINEAVELAKKYGGADSPRFVNGILGKVAERLQEFKTGQ